MLRTLRQHARAALVVAATLAMSAAQAFTLVGPGAQARVVVDPSLPDCVRRAAQDLTNDVKKIPGADLPLVHSRLQVLHGLGLGYLTLGEATPSLSGGEAQRLKLASEMGRAQEDTIFVFDEPTIGLHPLDVKTLLGVFRHLIGNGATVIVIEHDLDVIRSSDYVVDMGPGGGVQGGRIVACGAPAEIEKSPDSVTGRYLG